MNGVSGNIGSEGELSVNEAFSRKLQVYPNPSNGYYYLTIPERVNFITVSILSSSGQLLSSENIDVNFPKVNSKNLTSGMYVLKIEADNYIAFKKVIKL